MMKVLVCHNRYRSNVPSGENRYVDDEIKLLRDAGVDVVPFFEENDSIINGGRLQMANAALGLLYSPTGVRHFRSVLRAERPDIVHIHNVYPLISPPVIRVAKAAGLPVVQRIHNFAHTCVSGAHFRDGGQCNECVGHKIAYPAIRHGCYRGSRPLSVAKVMAETANRGTWRMVDKFLVHTPFMGNRLRTAGISEEQITVLSPYAPDPGAPTTGPGKDFLFLGRFEEGKGILFLLDAWRARTQRGDRRLRIVGIGPLEEQVRSRADQEDDIDYLGYIERSQLIEEMQQAGVALIPSLFYEAGLPLVAIEALAHGRPILVNRGTSFASTVSDRFGWCIEPTVESWGRQLDGIKQEDIEARGPAARRYYEENCSPTAAVTSLLKIYSSLLGRNG